MMRKTKDLYLAAGVLLSCAAIVALCFVIVYQCKQLGYL